MSTPLTTDEVYASFDMHIDMQRDAVEDSVQFVEADHASFKHDADYLVLLCRAKQLYNKHGFVAQPELYEVFADVCDHAYEMRN